MIQASCSCGKSFQAKPELAGKKVKCPSCGNPFVIPDPNAAAAGETTNVTCSCGKSYRAKAEWAGKSMKCPACGSGITVPSPSAPADDPLGIGADNDPLGLGGMDTASDPLGTGVDPLAAAAPGSDPLAGTDPLQAAADGPAGQQTWGAQGYGQQATAKQKKTKKKSGSSGQSKKPLIIGGSAVGLVLVILLVLWLTGVFGGSKKNRVAKNTPGGSSTSSSNNTPSNNTPDGGDKGNNGNSPGDPNMALPNAPKTITKPKEFWPPRRSFPVSSYTKIDVTDDSSLLQAKRHVKSAKEKAREGPLTISLSGQQMLNVAFEAVEGIESEVKQLTVFGSGITEDALANLSKFTALERLKIGFAYQDSALQHVSSLSNLVQLDLSHNMTMKGHSLDQVKDLTKLKILKLENTAVDDQGFEHLKSLTDLEELHLIATSMTGEGLQHLAELPKLRYLSISGANLKGDAMSALSKLTNLESLVLSGPTIDDAALAHVSTLVNLKTLEVSRTAATGKGVDFSRLQKLTELVFLRSPIVDDGLSTVVGLGKLSHLDLQETKITDAALDHMLNIPGLRYVAVGGTTFSGNASEKLLMKSKNMSVITIRK